MIEADAQFADDFLRQSVTSLCTYADDPRQIALLGDMADAIVGSMRAGGKLLLFGNGGSAGDAQHIAGEFTGRMLYDRGPLPAIALTTDTSTLTAIGNDYGFDQVFERQVVAIGRPGDVALGLSTSGTSPNVVAALEAARSGGMKTLGFTGADGGSMVELTELLLRAPSRLTPVVQQIHITAGHILCALVERAMFPQPSAFRDVP